MWNPTLEQAIIQCIAGEDEIRSFPSFLIILISLIPVSASNHSNVLKSRSGSISVKYIFDHLVLSGEYDYLFDNVGVDITLKDIIYFYVKIFGKTIIVQ